MINYKPAVRMEGLRRLSRVVMASLALAAIPCQIFATEKFAEVPNSLRHPEAIHAPMTPALANEVIGIAISLAPRDQQSFEEMARDVSDPRSANFHKFMTPEEIGKRFGPNATDISDTVKFLRSNGLTVERVSKSGLVVEARGTAEQISSAFRTRIGYASSGEGTSFRTNLTSLQMPSHLVQRVVSIDGIDTSMKREVRGHRGSKAAAGKQLQDPTTTLLTPITYNTAFGVSGIQRDGFFGQGVNIAIANYDGFRLANIPYWVSTYHMPVPRGGVASNIIIREVGQPPYNNTGFPVGEGDLDLEAVMMSAPLANIYDYDDSTTDDAAPITVDAAISDDNLADIVTESYGFATAAEDSNGHKFFNNAFDTAAFNLHTAMTLQGITLMSATGDDGTLEFSALTPGAVRYGYPDIDPNFLMVGGTIETVDDFTGARVSEASWGLAGGAGGTGGYDPYDSPSLGFHFNVAPPYQTDNIPGALGYPRLVPDISSIASGGDGGSASPLYYFSEIPGPLGELVPIGGTSLASPATAGSLAAFISKVYKDVTPNVGRTNVRLGLLHPFLYSVAGNSVSPAINDITLGDSIGNLPGTNIPANPGQYWDFATGLGSIQFNGLLLYSTVGLHMGDVHPNFAMVNSANQTITVNGDHFTAYDVVIFNGAPLPTTFVRDNMLQAMIPAADLTGASESVVAVANVFGPPTEARTFEVRNPQPSVSSVSPSTEVLNGPSFTLDVYGSNFVPTSTVEWNHNVLPTTFVTPMHLQATVASQYLQHQGEGNITVTNAKPGGGQSNGRAVQVVR